MKSAGRESVTLLAFCLFSILVRWPSFFATVIDHDESTYIIIADQLLQGYLPYVHNIDVKPPGIYLLFSSVLKVFDSIVAIRVMAAIAVGLTGFLLYRSHLVLFSFQRIAIASGLLYVICASAHKWSWSANTEIFFVCCTSACLYLILIARNNWHFMLFGLIASLGFLIKFHIAFDILALAIFYFFWQERHFRSWFEKMLLAFIVFCIPLFGLFFLYRHLGYEDQLHFALFTVPRGYTKEFSLLSSLKYIAEFYFSFLPFAILWFYGIYQSFKQKWLMLPQWILLVASSMLGWVGILITGKMFFHYYFQALLPLCLFAFVPFMQYQETLTLSRALAKKWFPSIGLLLILVIWINQYVQIGRQPDVPNMIYQEIHTSWNDNKKIYTNDKNILYYLLNTQPPTRFTHTSILSRNDLIQAYQVNVEEELNQIVEQKMDYYVLGDRAGSIIENDVKQNFRLVKILGGKVRLYERNPSLD